jgi:hypothetical protein
MDITFSLLVILSKGCDQIWFSVLGLGTRIEENGAQAAPRQDFPLTQTLSPIGGEGKKGNEIGTHGFLEITNC